MLISTLNFYVLAALMFLAHLFPLAGFSSAAGVLWFNRKHAADSQPTIRERLYLLLSLPSLILLSAFLIIPVISKLEFGVVLTPSVADMSWFSFSFVAGIAAAVAMLRTGAQFFDKAKNKLTKTTELERNKKTDVREINKFLPEPIGTYDVHKYIDFKKGVFLGIDENKKPIYWPAGKLLPHMQVAGTNGSGKGVFTATLLTQCLGMGECCCVVDPKFDEFLMHVLADAAKRYNKPYYYVDLRPKAPPQINFFAGADAEQIEELFVAGFGLGETGNPGVDHHRIADRAAATWLSKEAAKPGATPQTLFAEHYDYIKTDLEATDFASYLKEMAGIPSVNALVGLDLRGLVRDGGVAYFVGSMRNTKILRMQKMLTIKLIQLAEERDRTGNAKLRPIALFLDEFIYHISKATLEGLGAARDKGMHFILAHQAIADFARCGADLDKEAVKGAVMENCKLKLVYRLEDPETAEWLAQKSGKILVDDESRIVDKNVALAEVVDNKRTIRQAERYYIDVNMIENLHERLGIIFGLGLPIFSFSSPIQTTKDPKNLICTIAESAAVKSASDQLDVPEAAPSAAKPAAASMLDVDEPAASPFPSSSPFPSAPSVAPSVAQPAHADDLL